MALDFNDDPFPTRNVDSEYITDWRKIVKVDSMDRPGQSELKLVMARQVFSYKMEVGTELIDVEE